MRKIIEFLLPDMLVVPSYVQDSRLGSAMPAPGRSGQATLSFVLLVAGIVIEAAIAGSFVTYFLSTSGSGERLSSRAFAAAMAGVRDIELKVVRDKDFAGSGPRSYSFSVGADTASLAVSRAAPDATSYVYTATSTGTAVSRSRRLVAIFIVDQATGLVSLSSVDEQPF
jgi:hypothetical protein